MPIQLKKKHALVTGSIGALLALFITVGANAEDLKELPALERTEIDEHITINLSTHPIKIPLNILNGARFMGGGAESILFSKSKHLTVSHVHADDWGRPTVSVNTLPGIIFSQDFEKLSEDGEALNQAKGISENIFAKDYEKFGIMKLSDGKEAYIAFSPEITTIMITSEDLNDFYTDISARGFTWEEITTEILNGVN